MNRFCIVFILLASGLFGQDHPMFDSLDYFTRNKIKKVHYYISSWYYSPGWDYLKLSFDKRTNILSCDSIHYADPSSPMTKTKASDTRGFVLRDTVYHRPGFSYSSTIKYQFDKKGRLAKKLDITEYYPNSQAPGILPNERKYTTTTEYFYADSSSKKIIKTTTKSLNYKEERNFFYDKKRLIKRVVIITHAADKMPSVETFMYEYYPDGKLKKETRQVTDSICKTNCEGTIEYKYDTD